MKTKNVEVSDPSHPSHSAWLEGLMTVLRALTAIGPVVVAIADPKDATLASQLGQLAGVGIGLASNQPLG